ncbi:hypothetical protein [Pedobacter faecalis]|uniref:hypothetical protein n=1 Tax=Pedobacter faecalis TaxID=3041495 RepID=UPI0025507687|nr:hypothetical protein [Pedobacter sp. ELA7]
MQEKTLQQQDKESTADKLTKKGCLRNYTTEETRVHNKRIAKTGHIFLVVKANGKGFKCSNHIQVPLGLTEDQKNDVYEALYAQLQTRYAV